MFKILFTTESTKEHQVPSDVRLPLRFFSILAPLSKKIKMNCVFFMYILLVPILFLYYYYMFFFLQVLMAWQSIEEYVFLIYIQTRLLLRQKVLQNRFEQSKRRFFFLYVFRFWRNCMYEKKKNIRWKEVDEKLYEQEMFFFVVRNELRFIKY